MRDDERNEGQAPPAEPHRDPLSYWMGSFNQVTANLRMMPPEARQQALELIGKAWCSCCGVERHPKQQVCPCVGARADG